MTVFAGRGWRMARINLEDSLFADPRFMKLCVKLGDELKAVGALVMAFRLSQEFWGNDRQRIPTDRWASLGSAAESIIEVGLARIEPSGVYVCGSEQQHEWIFTMKTQRQAAGKASAEKRREKNEKQRAVESRSRAVNEPSTKSNETQHSYSYSCSSSSSLSDSDSSSDSKNEESAEPSKADSTRPSRARTRGCVEAFASDPVAVGYLEKVAHDVQQAWLETYGGVPWVLGEIRQAHVWIKANPQKAPKDFGRFMSAWLGRSHERQRKGIPSRRLTQSELNMQAIGDLYRKVNDSPDEGITPPEETQE